MFGVKRTPMELKASGPCSNNGYHGTYNNMSEKHLDRYVSEFSGRNNDRIVNTIDQMEAMARNMDGKRLRYGDLIG